MFSSADLQSIGQNIMVVRNLLIIVGIFALLPNIAAAMDSAALRRSVESYMAGYADKLLSRYGRKGRIDYSVASLDARLTLPDCAEPLKIEARDQGQLSSRLNLQVSCLRGNVWSVYVPVDINVHQPVVVAVKPLARGQTIGAGDVQLSEANISRLSGQYLTSLDGAVGMDVKRPILQGGAVLQEQLDAPLLVRRGEVVTISAETGAIAVKMQGVAMTDGRLGEQIRIKNKASSHVVEAQVVAPGQAMVRM